MPFPILLSKEMREYIQSIILAARQLLEKKKDKEIVKILFFFLPDIGVDNEIKILKTAFFS